MSEHPPIPDVAMEAAIRAWLDASHPLAADRVRAIAEAVAPVLWREWTHGMAVVALPEPDEQLFAGTRYGDAVASAICGEPEVEFRGHFHSPVLARTAAARLLAAANRAEQLAREVTS